MKLPDIIQNNQSILHFSGFAGSNAAPKRETILMKLRRVILVDDNPDFLAVSREFLEANDSVEVVGTATSAQDALELIEATGASVLITDLVMPSVSGLELTQRAKQRWPNLHVIVLTMHNTARHRDAAIDAGADAFITKSAMDSELLPVLMSLAS